MKRTTIFLAETDRAAIQAIKDRYGVSSDSDAIRLALRVLASAQSIALSPLPPRGFTTPYEDEAEELTPLV